MRKLVTAVLAVVMVATAGYFGARGWAQSRVEREVESGLAPLRASGGTVSHGAVEIELLRREVKLTDIVARTPGAGGTALRIGRAVATGIGEPGPGRLSATRLEIDDVAWEGTLPFAGGVRVTGRVPHLVLEGYAGPATLAAPGDAASPLDALRSVLQQATTVTAERVTMPAMTVSVAMDGPPALAVEYGYTGIVLRDVAGGRVGAATVDKAAAAVTIPAPAGGPGGYTTEIDGLQTLDTDINPVLAVLAGSTDDHYRQLYRKVTTGAYTVAFDTPQAPLRMTIDGFSADDVGLRPAKFPLERMAAVIGALPRAGQPPDPAQAGELLEMVSGVYEGLRFGSMEMRGMHAVIPAQPEFRLGAFRIAGFENGRIADVAMEGLDTRTPNDEPVRVGRVALRGFAVSDFMRSLGRLAATAGRDPSPEQILALLHVLEGVELRGVSVPAPAGAPGQTVDVDTLRLSWGDFVDAFPTRVDAALRVTGPIRREDGELAARLADAGITTMTVDTEAGLRWRADGGVLTLQPFTVGVPGIGAVEVKAAVANVPRAALTLDPAAFLAAVAAAEAGPVEYRVKDLGVLDLAVADLARTRSLSADEARRVMTESAIQPAAALVPLAPDIAGVADAVAQFLERGGGTLTVTATPKGHVALLPLIAAARDNPVALLGQFRLAATVTR